MCIYTYFIPKIGVILHTVVPELFLYSTKKPHTH